MKVHVHYNAYGVRHALGTLQGHDGGIVFRYHPVFLTRKIALSPFMLPLDKRVYANPKNALEGLFGLFYDSLPAGWGLTRLDKAIQDINGLTDGNLMLKRLVHVGKHGMGALEYTSDQENNYDFFQDMLAGATADTLDSVAEQFLQILRQGPLSINSAPSGTNHMLTVTITDRHKSRPYILANVTKSFALDPSGEPWIIKFRAQDDDPAAGLYEYQAMQRAAQAGLDVPETHLFPSNNSPGYFAIKRFDRVAGQKVHIHSACGLIHASHRQRLLDYKDLIKLTWLLTNSKQETLKMVQRMVFNVKAGNTDDHSKHFSFLLTKQNTWQLAPAYDVSVAPGKGHPHFTRVNGKDRNILDADLVQAADIGGISASAVQTLIEQVQDALVCGQ